MIRDREIELVKYANKSKKVNSKFYHGVRITNGEIEELIVTYEDGKRYRVKAQACAKKRLYGRILTRYVVVEADKETPFVYLDVFARKYRRISRGGVICRSIGTAALYNGKFEQTGIAKIRFVGPSTDTEPGSYKPPHGGGH